MHILDVQVRLLQFVGGGHPRDNRHLQRERHIRIGIVGELTAVVAHTRILERAGQGKHRQGGTANNLLGLLQLTDAQVQLAQGRALGQLDFLFRRHLGTEHPLFVVGEIAVENDGLVHIHSQQNLETHNGQTHTFLGGGDGRTLVLQRYIGTQLLELGDQALVERVGHQLVAGLQLGIALLQHIIRLLGQ